MKSFPTLALGLLVFLTNTAWADDQSTALQFSPATQETILTRDQLTGDWGASGRIWRTTA